MCTVILLRRPGDAWPLLLGANRDEMQERPWRAPAHHWPDRPEVIAGLDELAGGSWLGLNRHGVVAALLNRMGTLGPKAGNRSRGELVLEALDHADARDAAEALAHLDTRAYRTFNLIIADNRDAFWLRHADETGAAPLEVHPIHEGLSMIAAGDLDDPATPRLARYRPRFDAAPIPDPATGDWRSWEALLAEENGATEDQSKAVMRFTMSNGFATVSSSLIALPAADRRGVKPVFRFRGWKPEPTPWQDVLTESAP